MTEYIGMEFKRKGTAWKKTGIYVPPPQPDQWDGFINPRRVSPATTTAVAAAPRNNNVPLIKKKATFEPSQPRKTPFKSRRRRRTTTKQIPSDVSQPCWESKPPPSLVESNVQSSEDTRKISADAMTDATSKEVLLTDETTASKLPSRKEELASDSKPDDMTQIDEVVTDATSTVKLTVDTAYLGHRLFKGSKLSRSPGSKLDGVFVKDVFVNDTTSLMDEEITDVKHWTEAILADVVQDPELDGMFVKDTTSLKDEEMTDVKHRTETILADVVQDPSSVRLSCSKPSLESEIFATSDCVNNKTRLAVDVEVMGNVTSRKEDIIGNQAAGDIPSEQEKLPLHSKPPPPPNLESEAVESPTPDSVNEVRPIVDEVVARSRKKEVSAGSKEVPGVVEESREYWWEMYQPLPTDSAKSVIPVNDIEQLLVKDTVMVSQASRNRGKTSIEGPRNKEEDQATANDMSGMLRRLEKKRKKPCPSSSGGSLTRIDQTHKSDFEKDRMSKKHMVTPRISVTQSHVVTQQQRPRLEHRNSPQKWMTYVVRHCNDSPLKGSPFHVALQKRGFLDQYVFRDERSLHCVPVSTEQDVEAPIGKSCGQGRQWRSSDPKSFEFSLSDTLELNQLRWEAALLLFINSHQDETRFPNPVEICKFKNKVALNMEMQNGVVILGTLAEVLQLHCTFGMGTVPESVVAWLVAEVVKTVGCLHKLGVAHNDLGFESFLVARQANGTDWTLILTGVGSKSVVQVGDDLKLHFAHDMLSVAFLTWSILMGCSAFSFTIVNGNIRVEGIDCITTNLFLRGRDGWKELFAALVNSGAKGIGSVPHSTLDSIGSIVRMGGSDNNGTQPNAVTNFFQSLLDIETNAGGTLSHVQFAKNLGISSEELVFRLHFGQPTQPEKVPVESHGSPQPESASNHKSPNTKEVGGSPAQMEASTRVTFEGSGSLPELDTERNQQHCCLSSRASHTIGGLVVDEWNATKQPERKKRRKKKKRKETIGDLGGEAGPGTKSPGSDCSENPHKSRRRMETSPGGLMHMFSAPDQHEPHDSDRAVKYRPAKSKTSARRKLVETKRRSSRTKLCCGMNGCKSQFPMDAYMWVMMVGLEEQKHYKSLPRIPIYHPMHLVCLHCREPNGEKMFLTDEILTQQHKSEVKRWDKHLYYQASRVEYDKLVHKVSSQETVTHY